MTGPTRDPAALLRGAAAAGLTATLAVAAHASASGALPTGAVGIALVVVAGTVGAIAATARGADRTPVLVGLLGAGQVLAHVLLDIGGHAHSAASPSVPMWCAHVGAVTLGAALIASGGRLCAALSRAVRVAVRLVGPRPSAPVAAVVTRDTGRTLQATLVLLGSVTHRGPPVGATH